MPTTSSDRSEVMHTRWRTYVCLVTGGLLLAGAAPSLFAQSFPSKPIRAISQFGSGSSGEPASRIVTGPMGELLGQPIVVENRPGATGLVAAEPVARAAPDGYTLLIGSPSQMVCCAEGTRT